jgi:hypothetical protein
MYGMREKLWICEFLGRGLNVRTADYDQNVEGV